MRELEVRPELTKLPGLRVLKIRLSGVVLFKVCVGKSKFTRVFRPMVPLPSWQASGGTDLRHPS